MKNLTIEFPDAHADRAFRALGVAGGYQPVVENPAFDRSKLPDAKDNPPTIANPESIEVFVAGFVARMVSRQIDRGERMIAEQAQTGSDIPLTAGVTNV